MNIPESKYERVVIVGGGFAGLELAQALRNKPYQVLLLDKNNHFTFQPLLYQVATSGLEPNSIAYPFRRVFHRSNNILFRMAEVDRVDTSRQVLSTNIGDIDYDFLVVATGTKPNFFGLDPSRLLPLKSVPQALQMRNRVLKEFERALVSDDQLEKEAHTNFVVVGGGPTGVELAGALGEMKKFVLPKDYPQLDLSMMNIYLLEGLDRLLPAMSEKASERSHKYLEELGVNIHLNTLVKEYDGQQIEVDGEPIPVRNLIWTAGVVAAPIEGLEDALQDSGQLFVDEYNRVKGFSNVFAIGDVAQMASEENPKGHPMLAPVAQQQGAQVGKNLIRLWQKKELQPFEYFDKGTMATIGRNRAVADIGKVRLGGFIAWLAWMFVHLITLVGFRNKLVVLVNWVYNYFTYDKALRLIIKRGSNEEEYFDKKEEVPASHQT